MAWWPGGLVVNLNCYECDQNLPGRLPGGAITHCINLPGRFPREMVTLNCYSVEDRLGGVERDQESRMCWEKAHDDPGDGDIMMGLPGLEHSPVIAHYLG